MPVVLALIFLLFEFRKTKQMQKEKLLHHRRGKLIQERNQIKKELVT
jgi:hypothetical protein